MADGDSVKVVGIYGSPRQSGNSATLLDAALEGAESAGAHVTRIWLARQDVAPCQNCQYCSSHGECHIKDDMQVVYDALDNSDVVLLGAPIYFCSLCAQAKTMIDRCQPYWARKYVLKQDPPRRGRIGGFVCCCGFKDDRFLKCTEQIVKTWYFIMGIAYQGCCFVPGLDALGDAAKNKTAIDDAAQYGRSLAERAEELR